MSATEHRRRTLCITALLILGAAYLADPFIYTLSNYTGLSKRMIAFKGFTSLPIMAGIVGSVLALTQILRSKADRLGLFAGVLTVMGFTAGARIGVIGQLQGLLFLGVEGVPTRAIETILVSAPPVWASIFAVGLFYPIGTLIFGLTLAATRRVPAWIGWMLAIGGVLFPVGRAADIQWAILACDVVLGVTYPLLAWQLAVRDELWREETERR
jgi:hypothetical protein